jgi:hypothetical protein
MLTAKKLSTLEGVSIPGLPGFNRETRASNVLELVNLTPLMELTRGRTEIVIGLVDGPVAIGNPDLAGENVREIPGKFGGTCAQASSFACMHGTFVAGILCAREAPPRRLSVQAAPCSCVRFLPKRQRPAS